MENETCFTYLFYFICYSFSVDKIEKYVKKKKIEKSYKS